MSTYSSRVLGLAATISKGDEVDWAAALETARNEQERQRISALRSLADPGSSHDETLEGGHAARATTYRSPSDWGDLQLIRPLGSGTFGDVLLARDSRLDRLVALKLLSVAGSGPSSFEHVLNEGRLLARVDHPNVAKVYRVDQIGDCIGISMEYIQGHTLSQLVAENGPFDAREASLFGIDLCRALAAVHAQGILHRDIKAQNVMREEGGRTVLVDFGIGKDLISESAQPERLVGTPVYMAPELFAKAEETRQSDIYSTGVLLFHLVTGEYPVDNGPFAKIARQHREGRRRLLQDLRPTVPGPFAAVVRRATAVEPADRYATVGEMELAVAGSLVGAPPAEGPARRDRRRRGSVENVPRARSRRAVKIVLALALAVAAAFILRQTLPRQPAPGAAEGRPEPSQRQEDARFLENRVRQLSQEGAYLAAIRVLEKALAEEPEILKLRAMLNELLFEGGYERRARSELDDIEQRVQAAGLDDSSPLVLRILGTRGRILYRSEQAVAYFELLVRQAPSDSEAHYSLATALEEAGRLQEAGDAVEAALAVDRLDPRLHLLRASILAQSERPDDARRAIDEAERLYELIGIEAGNARTKQQRAEVEALVGDPEQAALLFRNAAAQYEQVGDPLAAARARHRAGDMAVRLYRLDEAADLYSAALPILTEQGHFRAATSVQRSLGRLALSRNDSEQSQRLLRQALDTARMLERDRSLLPTLVALATTLVQSRSTVDEGVDLAQEARALARKLHSTDDELAATLLLVTGKRLTGELQDGLELLERLNRDVHWQQSAPSRRLYALDHLISLHLQSERLLAAARAAAGVGRALTEIGARAEAGFFLATRAELDALLGRLEAARSDLEQASSLLEIDGLTPDESTALLGPRVLLALAEGRFDDASRVAAVDPTLRRWKVPWLLVLRSEALRLLDRNREAAAAAEQALQHPSLAAADEVRARLALALARSGSRGPTSTEPLRAAWDSARRMQLDLTAARIGALLLIDSDRPRSQASPSEAEVARLLASYLESVPEAQRPWILERWDVASVATAVAHSGERVAD